MGCYDHRIHAGNAGDVWKHFLLLEAADWFFASGSSLAYAESHAGRPEYILNAPGEWQGGIGSIWPLLPFLTDFCYFDILKDLNQEALAPARKGLPAARSGRASISEQGPGQLIYPGSTRFIYELAKRRQKGLRADVWDFDDDVADSWKIFSNSATSGSSFESNAIAFHQGDGFAGMRDHLGRSAPGLLFIDPPYIDPKDGRLAEELVQTAIGLGWNVMWWYMMDTKTAPNNLQTFELLFSEAGLDGGRWRGAIMALAGREGLRLDGLISHLQERREVFIKILKLE